MLTILIVLPILTAVFVLLAEQALLPTQLQRLAQAASGVTLAGALLVWARFDPILPTFQFVERRSWIPAFGVEYHVGVDGVSLLLVVVTAGLAAMALLLVGAAEKVSVRGAAAVLLLEGCSIAAFSARDLLLFHASAELALLPVFVLIGIGASGREAFTAIRFLMSALSGSVLMLTAILWMAWRHQLDTGVWTFAVYDLGALELASVPQSWLFAAFAFGLASRMPMFPFHSWFPGAIAQASTPAAVMLASTGALVGAYGLFRFAFPFFPDGAASFAPWIAVVAAGGAAYVALAGLVQNDPRRSVACMSVSGAGIVVLGLTTGTVEGTRGAVFHLVTCAIWTGCAIGSVRGEVTGSSRQSAAVSWRSHVPAALLVLTFASAVVPGAPAFVSAVLTFDGLLQALPRSLGPGLVGVAAMAMMLVPLAALRLWTTVRRERATAGYERDETGAPARWAVVAVCVVLIVVGLWPRFWLGVIDRTARTVPARAPVASSLMVP